LRSSSKISDFKYAALPQKQTLFENASKMLQKFPITKLSASELLDNGIATIG
jgi:hypothetical protein